MKNLFYLLLALFIGQGAFAQDYTISITGNVLTINDVSGNGETLDISENGRTYSLNVGLAMNFHTDVALQFASDRRSGGLSPDQAAVKTSIAKNV